MISAKKILVINSWGIGDMIMMTPAIKVLRDNFPDSQIDLLVTYQPVVGDILQEGQTVNRIIRFCWSQSSFSEKIKLISKLRKEKYDLSLIGHQVRPFKARFLNLLIGAKKGFGAYNLKVKKDQHKVDLHLNFLEKIGLDVKKASWPFFEISSEAAAFADNFIRVNNLENKIIVGFHPGADKAHKYLLWPKEYFIELGKKIIANYQNSAILIFGGPGEEDLCREIKNGIDQNAFLATGLTLKQVLALIDRCKIFIASDSGLGHVAAAGKASLISIFGPSGTEIYGPRGSRVKIISAPCRHLYDEKREHTCLKKITPDLVFDEIRVII